jgi:peroxiredoxin 5
MFSIGNLTLMEDSPANKVTTESLFAGKKVVLFGLPGEFRLVVIFCVFFYYWHLLYILGAFTPGCSKTHLPGYIADYEKFKAKGVDEIVCVTVNDPFVTGAWKEVNNCAGKVRILADAHAELTKALGVELDLTGPFGVSGQRMKRFSAYVVDGEIKVWNLEADNTGLNCSLAPGLLSQI